MLSLDLLILKSNRSCRYTMPLIHIPFTQIQYNTPTKGTHWIFICLLTNYRISNTSISHNIGDSKRRKYFFFFFFDSKKVYIGLFGIRLFCWNWKLFAESTVDKNKKLIEIVQWDPWIVLKGTIRPMNSRKNKLNSKIS